MSSTKRGKKNVATVAPEEDFEAFVRESLARLCEGQDKIMQDISNLKAKVQLNGCYYWNDIPLSIRMGFMRFIVMFVTAVCVLFLIKLRWPKKQTEYSSSLFSSFMLK